MVASSSSNEGSVRRGSAPPVPKVPGSKKHPLDFLDWAPALHASGREEGVAAIPAARAVHFMSSCHSTWQTHDNRAPRGGALEEADTSNAINGGTNPWPAGSDDFQRDSSTCESVCLSYNQCIYTQHFGVTILQHACKPPFNHWNKNLFYVVPHTIHQSLLRAVSHRTIVPI